ncbi:MAG: hypothetical protein ACI4D3_15075 [Lachnospiraceae bacterium]
MDKPNWERMPGKDRKCLPRLHDFLFVLSGNGWIFLIGLILFLVLIPFSTAGLPGDSIFNIEVTHDQMKFRLIHQEVLPAVVAAAAATGLMTGIFLFRFVHRRKETTIFFSMGLTRTALFLNRMLAGILMLAGSIALPMALSFILNVKALGGYQGLLRNTVYLTAGIITVSFLSFILYALAAFLAGTTGEALVYWCFFMGVSSALCYGVNLLLKQLFWGNAWGETVYTGTEMVCPSLLEQYAAWNPILFFLEELEKHAEFVRPLSTGVPEAVSYGKLVCWMAVAAVLTALACIVLKRRKAENAGIAGTGIILPECVTALSGFLMFSIVFSFLDGFSRELAVCFGAASFLAVHLFWKKILFSCDMRQNRKKNLLSLIGQGTVVCVVCSGIFFGGRYGTEWFLNHADPVRAEVSYVGAPGFFNGEISGSSTGRGYYVTCSLKLDQKESIDKVKSLHRMFLESGRAELEASDEISDTVVPYDICFSYMDDEGNKHIWYYDRASFRQLEQMLSLEQEPSVKKEQEQLISGEIQETEDGQTNWAAKAYRENEVYLSDPLYKKTYQLTLDEEARNALLSAIQADLSVMTLEERYFPEESAQAVLMFSQNGEYDCRYYAYHLDNAFLYLTGNYVNTIGWLEDNQLLSLLGQSAEPEKDIECILLQKLDPYIGMNDPAYPMGMYFMSYCADSADEFLIQKDFGKKYTITDEEEIEAILPHLQNGYFMSRGGYLAAVKIKGEERYRYLFLPTEWMPE